MKKRNALHAYLIGDMGGGSNIFVFVARSVNDLIHDLSDGDFNRLDTFIQGNNIFVNRFTLPFGGASMLFYSGNGGNLEFGDQYYKNDRNLTTLNPRPFIKEVENRRQRAPRVKFDKYEMLEWAAQTKGQPGGKKELAQSTWFDFCQSEEFSKQTKADLLEIAKYLGLDVWEKATKREMCEAIRNYFSYRELLEKSPPKKARSKSKRSAKK